MLVGSAHWVLCTAAGNRNGKAKHVDSCVTCETQDY